MSMGLTSRQRSLLTFLDDYIASHDGVAPTYAEMEDHLGLRGRATIHRMLVCLEERRHIRRLFGRARAIEVIAPLAPAKTKNDIEIQIVGDIMERFSIHGDANRRVLTSIVLEALS